MTHFSNCVNLINSAACVVGSIMTETGCVQCIPGTYVSDKQCLECPEGGMSPSGASEVGHCFGEFAFYALNCQAVFLLFGNGHRQAPSIRHTLPIIKTLSDS